MNSPEHQPQLDSNQLRQWRTKIAIANRYNVFCHCRRCGHEWVDSELKVICGNCNSGEVESICCWQFPDG